jgi:hypothetical protein
MRVSGTARVQLEKMHGGRTWMWWMYREQEQEQEQLKNEVGRESGVAWAVSLGRFWFSSPSRSQVCVRTI